MYVCLSVRVEEKTCQRGCFLCSRSMAGLALSVREGKLDNKVLDRSLVKRDSTSNALVETRLHWFQALISTIKCYRTNFFDWSSRGPV